MWEHLLSWLVRNRSQRALNGVLLVVDLPALLNGKPDQRVALAHGLRTRLYEVSTQLGSRLPLYVVLTKFDLLDGFDQFYGKLPAAKRESLLGFTFKLDAVEAFDAWLDEYDEHYGQLLATLNEQVIDRLDVLGKTAPRGRLFSLQAQLVGLRPILLAFLREAWQVTVSPRHRWYVVCIGRQWCSTAT